MSFSLSRKYITLFVEDLIFEVFAKTKSPSHKKSDVYRYNVCR